MEDSDLRILQAVSALEERGYPPTYRDVAMHVGLALSAVHRRVRLLRGEGLVHVEDAIARSLVLTSLGRSILEHSSTSA